VYVGDRPYDDVRGARHAGMRAVWRANTYLPGGEAHADAVISSLPELVDIVDRWNA
jgi:putative hydrolase of the HAD superfamily